MSLELVNVVFGMKIRQARSEANLSLSEFATQAELSPSYVTEIEKGRKYPRADKILKMAQVLGKDYDDLVSIRLEPSLTYLESALSSSILQNFPFAEFGLEAGDLVNLLTRKPDKASALVHAILEIGRRYALTEEQFLRAALRSYQEIHENYFPELEEAAFNFRRDFQGKYALDDQTFVSLATLTEILSIEYRCDIDYTTLTKYPELGKYRAVYIPGQRRRLMINRTLLDHQIRFVVARELGYHYLGLKERSLASTPDQINSFQQILNDLKAAYFGGALLMPQAAMLADLQQLFDMPTWQPQPLVGMLDRYDATPEMLLYRFSELIPQFFGMKLHFLRFQHARYSESYHLVKQLNMNRLLVPSGIGLHEHYCRRWLSVRLLQDESMDGITLIGGELKVGVQLSEFVETQDRFLCLGFARPLVLSPQVTSSVIVGFRVDADLKHTIRFLDDPAVPHLIINETCERCPLTAVQCSLRAAEPTIRDAKHQELARKLTLNRLRSELRN